MDLTTESTEHTEKFKDKALLLLSFLTAALPKMGPLA